MIIPPNRDKNLTDSCHSSSLFDTGYIQFPAFLFTSTISYVLALNKTSSSSLVDYKFRTCDVLN